MEQFRFRENEPPAKIMIPSMGHLLICFGKLSNDKLELSKRQGEKAVYFKSTSA